MVPHLGFLSYSRWGLQPTSNGPTRSPYILIWGTLDGRSQLHPHWVSDPKQGRHPKLRAMKDDEVGSVWGWICPWKFGFQMKNTKPDQGKRRNGPRPIEWFYVWGGNWGACIRECLRQRSKVREVAYARALSRHLRVRHRSTMIPQAEQPTQTSAPTQNSLCSIKSRSTFV